MKDPQNGTIPSNYNNYHNLELLSDVPAAKMRRHIAQYYAGPGKELVKTPEQLHRSCWLTEQLLKTRKTRKIRSIIAS